MSILDDWINDLIGGVAAPVTAALKAGNVAIVMGYMWLGAFDPVILMTPLIAGQMRGMGFSAFRSRWAFVRQLLPLQGRLLVEQILWAMGPPWRSLLTGFNPVEIGDVGILVAFERPGPATPGTLPPLTNVDEEESSDTCGPMPTVGTAAYWRWIRCKTG